MGGERKGKKGRGKGRKGKERGGEGKKEEDAPPLTQIPRSAPVCSGPVVAVVRPLLDSPVKFRCTMSGCFYYLRKYANAF